MGWDLVAIYQIGSRKSAAGNIQGYLSALRAHFWCKEVPGGLLRNTDLSLPALSLCSNVEGEGFDVKGDKQL